MRTISKIQPIPFDIYQTWKTKNPALTDRPMRRWLASWDRMNPDCKRYLYDDADCQRFMEQHQTAHLATYLSLNRVERSDLWRYLVILKFGGIYTDADTICKKPVTEWLQTTDEAVIGIDSDYLNRYPNWRAEGHIKSGGAYNFSHKWHDNIVAFSNWTFAARAGHPILAEIVRRIEINVSDPFFVDQAPNWTIKKTGPGVMTDVIYDWLGERGFSAVDLVGDLRNTPSIVIDGVRFVDRPAFHWREVKHFGMGSWKPPSIVLAWRKMSRYWS